MKSRRPDFIFLDKNMPYLLYSPFVVELQVGDFDSAHKLRMTTYNTMILETSVRRHFVISIITNLSKMFFFKTVRVNHNLPSYKHVASPEINFWPDKTVCGLNYIKQMIDTPAIVGYDPSLNFTISIEDQ